MNESFRYRETSPISAGTPLRYAFVTRYAGILAFTVGALVLLGWLFDIVWLKSLIPGFVTMKVNTAIAVFMAGIGLLTTQGEQARSGTRWVGRAAASLILLLALLTLVQYFFDIDFGIDNLLFSDQAPANEWNVPGRMSPATAICLLLIGLALLLSHSRLVPTAVQILAVAVILLAWLVLLGYLFDVSQLYHIFSYTTVAVHTALILLAVGIGILFIRQDCGFVRVFVADDYGGLTLRRLLPVVIFVPLVVAWLRFMGQRAGFYETNFGIVLLVSGCIIVSVIFLWLTAASLSRLDQARLQESDRKYRELFDNMSEMVHCVGKDGKLLYVNRAWFEAMGYSEEEVLTLSLSHVLHPDELIHIKAMIEDVLAGEKVIPALVRLVTKAGRILWTKGITIGHIENGQPVATRIFSDVTEQVNHEREVAEYQRQVAEANARLETLASTDELTRVKNRRAFDEKLVNEIKCGVRNSSPLSLLMLDVDHFKQFNDTFGHPAGDNVLQGVARLLEENARSTDFVARYGGEEFVILLPNTDQHGAWVVAEKVRKAIQGGDWRERAITVSIGIASLASGGDGSALIKAADDALYCSKKSGRNCIHVAAKEVKDQPQIED
jgi:diguanylate cyclase (GGDEF)-like protein/PAS domain S-box-containing protein